MNEGKTDKFAFASVDIGQLDRLEKIFPNLRAGSHQRMATFALEQAASRSRAANLVTLQADSLKRVNALSSLHAAKIRSAFGSVEATKFAAQSFKLRQNLTANVLAQHKEHLSLAHNANRAFEEFHKRNLSFASTLNKSVTGSGHVAAALAEAQKVHSSGISRSVFEAFVDALDPQGVPARLDELEESALNAKTSLSLEFYLTVVFSLICFVIAQYSANEATEQLLERLTQVEASLIENLSHAYSDEVDSSFYIVETAVNFRAGPSTEDAVLAVLYPNLKVRLISRQSKWIKVEYYDYTENQHRQGWVFKKYLRLLNPAKPSKYIKR